MRGRRRILLDRAAVFAPAFVRRPDGTHPLCREVRQLLEQVVLHGSPAYDTHHPTHAACDSPDTILVWRRLAEVTTSLTPDDRELFPSQTTAAFFARASLRVPLLPAPQSMDTAEQSPP